MALLLLYSPAVVLLPIVLLALVLFVVVPGGFVIVLGGASWVLFTFVGLLRLAAERLLHSASATSRRAVARPARGGSRARALAAQRVAEANAPNDALGHALHVGDEVQYNGRPHTVLGPSKDLPDRLALAGTGGRALAHPGDINSQNMDADGARNPDQRHYMAQLRAEYGAMSDAELLRSYRRIDSPWMFHHQMTAMSDEAHRRGLDLRPPRLAGTAAAGARFAR